MWLNACNVSIYKYWKCIMYRKSKVVKCHILNLFKEVLQRPWELCIKQCLNLLVCKPLFKVLGSKVQVKSLLRVSQPSGSAARPFLPVTAFTGGVYIAGCDSPYLSPNNFHRGQFLMKEKCWISIQSLAHGKRDAYKHLRVMKFSWAVSYTGVRKEKYLA